MTKLKLAGALALAIIITGCLTLQPGADPLVVKAEQTLDIATNIFQTIVHVDDLNRSFWKSNAPAFHKAAETLRQPVWMPGMPEPEPWGASLIISAWNTKQAYKLARNEGNSNALYLSWTTLQSAVSNASVQLTIINNTNFVWPH